MIMRRFFTGMFLLTSLYLLLAYQFGMSLGAPSGSNSNPETHRPRSRTLGRISRPIQYARIRSEPLSDFIVDDDDLFEFSKRQSSDDYGHLRFGKRGEEIFDDYGHMRFGRSGEK